MTPECQHVSALSAEPLGDGLKTLPVSDGLHHSHAVAPSRRRAAPGGFGTYGTFCRQYTTKPMAMPRATRTPMMIPAMAPPERPSKAPSAEKQTHLLA